MCSETPVLSCDYNLVLQLKDKVNSLKLSATSAHRISKIFEHPQLNDCTHLLLRVKLPHQFFHPHMVPHEILSRFDKHITIDEKGEKNHCVFLERIKPAFILMIRLTLLVI